MYSLGKDINFIEDEYYLPADLLSPNDINDLPEHPFFINKSPPRPIEEQTTNYRTQLFVTKTQEKTLKGRKRKREGAEINNSKEFIHSKYASDNLLRKAQVDYISFITQYSNEVLYKFGFNESFIRMDYKIKKNVNKKNIIKLKELSIGEILCFGISPKFKTKEKSINIDLYNKAICNPIIKNIFSENYLSLFRNVYYPNKRIINLEKYGLNDTLILSEKAKTYKDLLIKNGWRSEDDKNNEYFKKLEDVIKKNF